MKKEYLAVIEKRANAATPGPWTVDQMDMYIHGADGHAIASATPGDRKWQVRGFGAEKSGRRPEGSQDANAAFIAHARVDVPALIEEVKELRESLRQERAIVRRQAEALRLENEEHISKYDAIKAGMLRLLYELGVDDITQEDLDAARLEVYGPEEPPKPYEPPRDVD